MDGDVDDIGLRRWGERSGGGGGGDHGGYEYLCGRSRWKRNDVVPTSKTPINKSATKELHVAFNFNKDFLMDTPRGCKK